MTSKDMENQYLILESKKVRDLLIKIMDPKLEGAKQAIKINQHFKNHFSMAINFLVESVDTYDKSKPRMISEVCQSSCAMGCGNAHQGRSWHRAGQGQANRGGRFQYRGNPNYQGGHGRGGHGTHGHGHAGRQDAQQNDNGTTNTYAPPAE
jgi:hypothetical protein